MQVDFSGGKLCKDHANRPSTELLNRANLECLKESPQNPGDWDLKPRNLFCHGILYPTRGLCCILLLLFGQR